MQFHEQIETISSKEDLAVFVEALHADFMANPDRWENATLDSFLEAMAAWIPSMDNVRRNMGKESLERPEWSTFADILYASTMYE